MNQKPAPRTEDKQTDEAVEDDQVAVGILYPSASVEEDEEYDLPCTD